MPPGRIRAFEVGPLSFDVSEAWYQGNLPDKKHFFDWSHLKGARVENVNAIFSPLWAINRSKSPLTVPDTQNNFILCWFDTRPLITEGFNKIYHLRKTMARGAYKMFLLISSFLLNIHQIRGKLAQNSSCAPSDHKIYPQTIAWRRLTLRLPSCPLASESESSP